MTRITIWHRQNEDGVMKFNHISTGWSNKSKPEAISEFQKKCWNNEYWDRQLGWLIEGKVVTTGAARFLVGSLQ